jgi:hypothetical protein
MNIADQFARHLELLLDFHRDDEPKGQGQFRDPVETVAPVRGDNASRYVTLASGQRLRITVEVA